MGGPREETEGPGTDLNLQFGRGEKDGAWCLDNLPFVLSLVLHLREAVGCQHFILSKNFYVRYISILKTNSEQKQELFT